jgi:ribosomal protein L31E
MLVSPRLRALHEALLKEDNRKLVMRHFNAHMRIKISDRLSLRLWACARTTPLSWARVHGMPDM